VSTPAERPVEVARERVPAATFPVGSAEDLPFDDATFDVVISVFGVMFAADAEAALAELVRILAPGGRALVTAWLPGGGAAPDDRHPRSRRSGRHRRAAAEALRMPEANEDPAAFRATSRHRIATIEPR
jgi:SAM-dependent methyltransferase